MARQRGHATTERIDELLVRLRRQPLGRALRDLAMLPIEQHRVPSSAFAPALASDNADARFWAALALARLGDLAPLERVMDEAGFAFDVSTLEGMSPIPAGMR